MPGSPSSAYASPSRWRIPSEYAPTRRPAAWHEALDGEIVEAVGYSDDEAMHWLLTEEESLGIAPIDALRAGRKAEVRRVAQALGF